MVFQRQLILPIGWLKHLQCDLHELSIEDMKKIEPSITEAVFEVLSVEKSVHSRNSYGGTSPDTILEQLNRVEKDYNLSS